MDHFPGGAPRSRLARVFFNGDTMRYSFGETAMPRKKRPSRRAPETLARVINISAVSARASVRAAQERGTDPHIHSSASLELTGTMDEPVRETLEIQIVLYAEDNPTLGAGPPPWIGLVERTRPTLRATIFVSHRDFDRAWSLVL
jgi:hypothetical protein